MRAERKPTHLSQTARPFVRLLRSYPQLSSRALDSLERRSFGERAEVAESQAMLRAAVTLTGDEDLGLRAARATELGDFEVIEYVCASAPTLRALLEALVRYRRLVDEAAEVRLDVRSREARFVLGSSVPLTRAGVDYQVAALFVVLNRWLRPTPPDIKVRFRHAAPPDVAQYHETFGSSRVGFAADFDGLVFEPGQLDAPLRTAEATSHGLLRTCADRMLAEVTANEAGWLGRLRADILERLSAGRLNADAVAAHFGMSRRTLARKLEQAGTTFSAQVLELRCRSAERYLRDTEQSVEEIAFLLGFSHPAPFVTAFKRWARMTPTEFRRAQRAG